MSRDYAIPFLKGQGCFNTFLIFDLISCPELYTQYFVKRALELLIELSYDDVLILLPSEKIRTDTYTVRMDILEPDGSFAAFCGNGVRVVGAYLERLYGSGEYAVITDRKRTLIAHGNGLYSVYMGPTLLDPSFSQFVNTNHDFTSENGITWNYSFPELATSIWYFTQTGEPHLVSFESISDEQLFMLGTCIRTTYQTLFPQGISLNVVQVINESTLMTRTFERGVNRITQACGSGSTSSAALAYTLGYISDSVITIHTQGGLLTVTYNSLEKESTLSGPAVLDTTFFQLILSEELP